MSIRSKLTLALLVASFAAIAVVGLTARVVTLERFDTVVVDRAAVGFLRDVVAYHRAYGSWEAARESEPFFDFTARARRGSPDGGSAAASEGREGGRRPGPSDGLGLGGTPPPFAVTDLQGRAVLPLAGLDVGAPVSPERLEAGLPIRDGGRQLGFAVPMERPVLTEMEEQYLSGIEDAWLYSLLFASLVVVPFGLFVGSRLARPIRDMTAAMEEMGAGRLLQEVDVRSGDEVGRMATSLNEMSRKLSRAYDELEASRAKLGARAQEMTELSRRDPLTGLLNRRAFDERTAIIHAQGRRYEHRTCVALLDVDHFKRINDEFSHAVGDEVLAEAARILEGELRESDVVARYGGEEFVVTFPETTPEAAAVLAERLRGAFESFDWSDLISHGTVTISIGVAEVEDADTIQEALARADARLYEAKATGRNRVVSGPGPTGVPGA